MNYYEQVESLIKNNEINKKVRALQDNGETLYTYWNIGKLIIEAQGGEKRAKYGDGLIKEWGNKLSEKYGKNYDKSNLSRARMFYLYFPNVATVSQHLSWSQYCDILPIKNPNERNYYINQVILNNLSVRDLRREIKNKSFDRLSYADKENIEVITEANETDLSIVDMIKDPIILKPDKTIDKINEKAIHKYIISKERGNKLSEKYGKNYDKSNLSRAKMFYLYFPIVAAVRQQLSWTHYKLILPIKNINERNYYINRVILNNLSTRELQREIKNKSFDRLSYADKNNIEIISDNTTLSIKDMIKDPIILKSDIDPNEINEKVIHKYIISLLEDKFLELGTGFALVAMNIK